MYDKEQDVLTDASTWEREMKDGNARKEMNG